jgi:hypothetical protein
VRRTFFNPPIDFTRFAGPGIFKSGILFLGVFAELQKKNISDEVRKSSLNGDTDRFFGSDCERKVIGEGFFSCPLIRA